MTHTYIPRAACTTVYTCLCVIHRAPCHRHSHQHILAEALGRCHFHCIIIRDLILVIPEWSSGFPYFLPAGDLRELPKVPLRGEGSCGGGGAALAWASLAQRFPASSVLAREGAGCGSVGDVPGAWLDSAPLSPSLWIPRHAGFPRGEHRGSRHRFL